MRCAWLFTEGAAMTMTPPSHDAITRSLYVSRLIRMDWQFEHAEGPTYRSGRDELAALKSIRAQIDSDCTIWNRYAPPAYQSPSQIRTFTDFAGSVPVTVEWCVTLGEPHILAVVVDNKNALSALNMSTITGYLDKARKLMGNTPRLDAVSAFAAPEAA